MSAPAALLGQSEPCCGRRSGRAAILLARDADPQDECPPTDGDAARAHPPTRNPDIGWFNTRALAVVVRAVGPLPSPRQPLPTRALCFAISKYLV